MYEYYRGYVKTKGKVSIESLVNVKQFKTFEVVQDAHEYAGVLAENTVLIDVDDEDQANVMFDIIEGLDLKCRVIETTRGYHFLFKNSGIERNATKKQLICGLTADIKLGTRNSYQVLKFDGKVRRIMRDTDEPDEVPYWMFPIAYCPDFFHMGEGGGRNQAMFNYILTLQSEGLNKEQIIFVLEIINEFVLETPLSDDEFSIVTRDEAFRKPVFFKGNTFLFDKFAEFLKNTHHIVRINGQLYIYDSGVYISSKRMIESQMIKHVKHLSRSKRAEVYEYLELLVPKENLQPDANLIAFNNGVYNIHTDEFLGFSPSLIVTNRIPWDYNKDAYSKLCDETLDKIATHDPNIRALLEEMTGYCFYRRNELGKAFILTGDRNNGKSTFLDMLQTMLGMDNVSALDINELGERFLTAELASMLANIGDDIGDDYIPSTRIFKKLATGDRVTAEHKGQDPFKFNSYAKLLFSTNSIPRMGKGRDSSAIIRRLVIVPFEARFSKSDPDFKPYIKYELRKAESIEYLIQVGIQGLKRVLLNDEFTASEKVDKQIEEYEEENNPIIGFFKEIETHEVLNNETKDVYTKYVEYCLRNSLTAISNIPFSKQIKKHFDVEIVNKKINGKKCRIFERG